ncbi:MAG: UvrB/UvrC motif-containing protein [Paludibacteraceae bacterium]|nr:UvrB/UvrC motif-containing protein [Paludibacteraceae bacterium]
MDERSLSKALEAKRRAMLAAAKETNFEIAARLRDEMLMMQEKLDAFRA